MVGPDTSVLRVQLEDERERLQARLRELGAGEAFDEGFADSSQVTAERGELDAIAGTLADSLREVQDALGKLDAGTFGACESCGDEIPAARLEAKPAARLCITCASKNR
jgi:RNA polymerase-binding transcription factor